MVHIYRDLVQSAGAKEHQATQEKNWAEKRLHELDNLIAKIYEDRGSEKINERTFTMLTQKYEQEQGSLKRGLKH